MLLQLIGGVLNCCTLSLDVEALCCCATLGVLGVTLITLFGSGLEGTLAEVLCCCTTGVDVEALCCCATLLDDVILLLLKHSVVVRLFNC